MNHPALSTTTCEPQSRNTLSRVPLLDLNRENGPLRDEIQTAISQIMESGRFVLGPDCEQLENRIATLCGTSQAVGCASGSDALLLALMARDIGPGDEVIVPSFTFFATASAVWRLGARPVFVDILPDSFCLDPQHVSSAITPRTRAIVPVHLFGQSAEMEPIVDAARQRGLFVLEDCAQSIGATYHGRPVGSLGDAGAFSFYPTKNLGGFGDGGMLTTSSDEFADALRLLRLHGMRPKYLHERVGINSRMDTLQAAVLGVKLTQLSTWTARRCQNAARYDALFAETGLDEILGLPCAEAAREHVWNQYTIRVPDLQRDALRQHLTEAQIGTEVYYPVPLHQQPCFAALGYETGSLPETERAANEVLSLPIFPGLTEAEQYTVVVRIAEFFESR